MTTHMILYILLVSMVPLQSDSVCEKRQQKDICIYVNGMDTVTLKCKRGNLSTVWFGPINYELYANGLVINPTLQKYKRLSIVVDQLEKEIQLQISNFSKEDEGSYKCTHDGEDIHFQIYLQVDFKSIRIQNETSDHFIYGFEDKPLGLICSVDLGKPVEIIEWKSKNRIFATENNWIVNYTFIPKPDDHLKNFTCIAKIEESLSPLTRTVRTFIYHAPNVLVKYNSSENQFRCLAKGIPDNYTYYSWYHLSFYHQHIRSLDGDSDGRLTLPEITGETDRHCDRGIYVCRVSNGIFLGKTAVITAQFVRKKHGKPYFVSSNEDVQSGVKGQPVVFSIYVVSIPKVTGITVLNNNFIAVETNCTGNLIVKTYDIVYGKKVTTDASKLSCTILSTVLSEPQKYTVIVSNHNGSNKYTVSLKPTAKEETSIFQNQTQMIMMIVVVVIALLLLFAGIIGMKALHCRMIKISRGEHISESAPEGEGQHYDEVDNPNNLSAETNTIPQEIADIELEIQIPTAEANNPTKDNNIIQIESQLCFSEVDGLFNTRISSTSTESSDSSYQNPSKPYTELKHTHNRSLSLHEYERIPDPVQTTDLTKHSGNLPHKDHCVKRSTI